MSEVDWSARRVAETMQRYFGRADAPAAVRADSYPSVYYVETSPVAGICWIWMMICSPTSLRWAMDLRSN